MVEVSVFFPVVVACNILVNTCFLVVDPEGPYDKFPVCEKSLPGMAQHAINNTPGSLDDYQFLICCSNTEPDEGAPDGNINCLGAEDVKDLL